MASIKQRKTKDGKTHYYIQIRLKGQKPVCASFERLTDARKWIQDTESDIRAGRHFKTAESKNHTLGDMIDRYIENVLPTKEKCKKGQGTQLLWWKQQIGHKLLADVTPALICELRDKLLKETTVRKKLRTPATVVRYLAALSHAFSICVREFGWLEDSPMRKVTKPSEPRGRVRFLSDEERAKLLDACKKSPSPFLYIAFVLALSTGLRKAELMNLRWPDVDLERGRIVLHVTKNGDRRTVPLTGLGLQLLKELDRRRRLDTNLLFPGLDPKKPIDLRNAWEKALQEAGITNYRWHDNRHSCASYLAMNKASLAEIAEVLGHKTISITKRYSHLSESHTVGVVSSMNERIFG